MRYVEKADIPRYQLKPKLGAHGQVGHLDGGAEGQAVEGWGQGIPQLFQSGHVLLDVLIQLRDIIARRDDEHFDHHGPSLAVALGDLEEPRAAEALCEPDPEVRVQVLDVALHGGDLGGGDPYQLVTHHSALLLLALSLAALDSNLIIFSRVNCMWYCH